MRIGTMALLVVSKNLRRRHLNEAQRAMVGAKIATLKHGHNSNAQVCALPSQTRVADMLNVGRRSRSRAKRRKVSGTLLSRICPRTGENPTHPENMATRPT
jgi:hypothetical protein